MKKSISVALGAFMLLAAQAGARAQLVGSASDSAGRYMSGDFDGNGYADLVLAAPGETIDGVGGAGAVHVIYGAEAGLSPTNAPGTELVTLASFGGQAAAGDRFGAAVAAGDFDGDGYADLAVGAPGRVSAQAADAGVVYVVHGGPDGLDFTTVAAFSQTTPGIEDLAEEGDRFGSALAAGDFNDDWYCDLAVGVPFEDVGSIADAGGVNVIYGAEAGLSAVAGPGDEFWSQNSPDVDDACEANDHFGATLAVGNFGYSYNYQDGHELIVGVPDEDLTAGGRSFTNAGAVHVLVGTRQGGLEADSVNFHAPMFTATTCLPLDSRLSYARFGTAVAAGQYRYEGSADGYDDLAVGAPGFADRRGRVVLLYNDLYGDFDDVEIDERSQGDLGTPDAPEEGDGFGSALAAGDFDDDGADDLAVGIPFEDLDGIVDCGAVQVLRGSQSGLVGPGNLLLRQGTGTLQGDAGTGDRFGSSLATGPYGRSPSVTAFDVDDLAIGIVADRQRATSPFDPRPRPGAVLVLYGLEGEGLVDTGNQLWTQNTSGMPESGETGDELGAAVR
jgi:hypothetical protein